MNQPWILLLPILFPLLAGLLLLLCPLNHRGAVGFYSLFALAASGAAAVYSSFSTMVLISGILRFVQETRSGNAAENLLKMITTTTNVHRLETGSQEIPIEEVLVGDIIHLSAGDMVPADLRIIQAKEIGRAHV